MSLVDLPRSKSVNPQVADEAGTAPEDRSFRPDVEGLRAVAISLVLLYHAGVAGVSGGYVGVDVFFVISGFVITGVLLRERASTGTTSILNFYGRRARRIIPAASVVIVVTVVMSYLFLGIVGGNQTATDGLWATIFLANFHFAAAGTNYLTQFQLPSPLQNFWSLSVEEQFYIVYPSLFLLLGKARLVVGFRVRLAIVLTTAIVISFALSVLQTNADPTNAYFSPFTRAWELALGALIAISAPWLIRLPNRLASALTWIGLGMIVLAAVSYGAQTPYPGSAVCLPVVGTGLVIAGGTSVSRLGAETLLRLWPFRQLGKLSYSLYLWHWPILILAAESAGDSSLSVGKSLLWLLVALGLSITSYITIENPIRHSSRLRRNGILSVGIGIGMIAATLVVIEVQLDAHSATAVPTSVSSHTMTGAPSLKSIEKLVSSAPTIHTLPQNIDPPLGTSVLGYPYGSPCWARPSQTSVPPCVFGDPRGARTMVLVGDSHAEMWFYTVDAIAEYYHWRLLWLTKSSCPAVLLPVVADQGYGTYTACASFHSFLINRIKRLDPDLVIVSEENRQPPNVGNPYSDAVWTKGLEAFFRLISSTKTKFDVIGNIPILPKSGPNCIARHTQDLQTCNATRAASESLYHQAERTAVEAFGGRYIDPTPWFCSNVCTPVIGNYQVYFDDFHVMGPYALHLAGALAQALQLQRSTDVAEHPSTEILRPRSGAKLSGRAILDAWANVAAVDLVQFVLNGPGHHHDIVVATGQPSQFGWLAYWDTTGVPNGTYRLKAVAHSSNGAVVVSGSVRVDVRNTGQ